jgi:hypothetical protein
MLATGYDPYHVESALGQRLLGPRFRGDDDCHFLTQIIRTIDAFASLAGAALAATL